MVAPATKTNKSIIAVPQKAGATFFRKAGEQSFFGAQKNPAFFGKPVQAKLTISTPDDPHEKEADAVADKVMRMPETVAVPASPPPVKEDKIECKKEEEIQPKQEPVPINKVHCKEDNEEKLQAKSDSLVYRSEEKELDAKQQSINEIGNSNTINRKNISLYSSDVIQCSGRGPPESSISLQQNLSASKGTGSQLPDGTRNFMENRFDADFSSVRVHTNSNAEKMTGEVQAQAFTHGSDIYFNKGKYSPDSSGGRSLLAHELTHTIQQGSSPVNNSVSRKQVQRSDIINLAPQAVTANQPRAPDIDISNKSGGSALPDEAKKYFEHSFKADVSDIRIHTDDEATEICRSHRVAAFTQGRHICFDPSRYSPDSEEGGKLLSKQVSASLAQRAIHINKVKGKAPAVAKKTVINTEPKNKKKPGTKGKGGKDNKKKGAKHKAKGKGNRSDGPPVKSVKPNPKKAPSHPDEDPAFQKVISKTKKTTKAQEHHDPAEAKATDAQKASPTAPKEAESKAQERKTDGLDAAGKEDKPFDAISFKADLLKKIEDVTPKTLEDATAFKENNKIGDVKNVMGDKVSGEKQDTTGPVASVSKQPVQANDADNKHPLPLPPTPKGPKPAGVGAQDAAPKPKLDNEISLQDKSKSLDDEMKANNVTEDQLAKSNEPSFTAALDQKKGAQKDADDRPKQYRKDEKMMLGQAKAGTQEESVHALAGMDAARGKNFGSVVQHQQSTKSKDQLTRTDVAKNIEDKYAAAEAIVTRVLDEADKESNRIFDEGSEAAKKEFEDYVDAKMTAYKEDRYSGFWGGLSWLEDKVFGMPDEVNVFYTQGRQLYLDRMDQVITQVANYVTSKLNEAKQAIKNGKKDIDDYVAKLPQNLQEVGKQAASDIQDKFDSLEQSVNDKKDQLIEGLAKKYVDNVKKIDDRISEMKEANAGLIDKAIGFLKKVWKVIKDLTNLFTSILSKLASIVGTILSSPGGFFDNLGKAFKQGFNNFKNKFLDYLEQGLMDWLATNLGIAGIELPKEFSPMAIFALVLQVLGLTKQHIKERAIAILGEKTVGVLETAGGILYRVATEGLGALWEMIKEKLTDLKDIVWDAIKSFIQSKVIEAAIVFLLSMLNPIGAFVKVCMAIYDFLMMLVSFKDRIMELLDSILKAVMDVAAGAIDGAANAIEKAFAKSIPVIIGFLAALLHLNDIAAKVREIITRIRGKVDVAIEFVIHKGVSLVKSAGKALGFGKDKDKKDEHSPEKQAKIDAGLITMHQEQKKYLKNGKINKTDAEKVAAAVKANHPVFTSFSVKDAGKKWDYDYTASPGKEEEGAEKAEEELQYELEDSFNVHNKSTDLATIQQIRRLLSGAQTSIEASEGDKRRIIDKLRGDDKTWTVWQGAIYVPFILEHRAAVDRLREANEGSIGILGIDRGGAMLAEQISEGSNIETRLIQHVREYDPNQDRMVRRKTKEVQTLIEEVRTKTRNSNPNEKITISVAETVVGGGSSMSLLKEIRNSGLLGQFPNLTLRILLLQQTMHDPSNAAFTERKITSAAQGTEINPADAGRGVVNPLVDKAGRLQVIISKTRYILGEDVNYQASRNDDRSKSPIILFHGSEESLKLKRIIPKGETTARDIINALVTGKLDVVVNQMK